MEKSYGNVTRTLFPNKLREISASPLRKPQLIRHGEQKSARIFQGSQALARIVAGQQRAAAKNSKTLKFVSGNLCLSAAIAVYFVIGTQKFMRKFAGVSPACKAPEDWRTP
jgi:hypothetical protein